MHIADVANDFLTQLYFPIVTVDYVNGAYHVSQKSANTTDHNTRWTIPLFVRDPKLRMTTVAYLLRDGRLCYGSTKANDPQIHTSKPLIFNADARSFARIEYTLRAASQLVSLNFSADLSSQSLVGLLSDARSMLTNKPSS